MRNLEDILRTEGNDRLQQGLRRLRWDSLRRVGRLRFREHEELGWEEERASVILGGKEEGMGVNAGTFVG